MRSLKRVQMAVLLVMAVGFLAGTPAIAPDWGTIQLTTTADVDDPDYGAAGQATLTNVRAVWSNGWNTSFKGKLTVTCKGLTPGARYSTPAGRFFASRDGRGAVAGNVAFTNALFVSVMRDDGTIVLWGTIKP